MIDKLRFSCVFPDLTKGKSGEQLAAEIKFAEDRVKDLPLERQQELRELIAECKELLAKMQ